MPIIAYNARYVNEAPPGHYGLFRPPFCAILGRSWTGRRASKWRETERRSGGDRSGWKRCGENHILLAGASSSLLCASCRLAGPGPLSAPGGSVALALALSGSGPWLSSRKPRKESAAFPSPTGRGQRCALCLGVRWGLLCASPPSAGGRAGGSRVGRRGRAARRRLDWHCQPAAFWTRSGTWL